MKENKVRSPRLGRWILEKILPTEESQYFIEGIEERYLREIKDRGRISAIFWYLKDILCTIPLLIIHYFSGSGVMFKNYVKEALRNLKRHKVFSFINIIGLTVGMVCFVLIMLYVQYELNFDAFHEKANRIFRVITQVPGSDYLGNEYSAVTPPPLASALAKDYPDVINATKIKDYRNNLVVYKDKKFYANGLFADEHFFDVFSFPLIQGDEQTALKDPFSVVITENFAKTCFGNVDAYKDTLSIEDPYNLLTSEKRHELKITGIVNDPPENSHIQFDFLLSFATWEAFPGEEESLKKWSANWLYTYLELQKDSSYKDLEQKMPELISKYIGKSESYSYILQPLRSIHLHSHCNHEISKNNDVKYIYLFFVIGFIILITACINYINLSTARASKRAREIAIRKALGAHRHNLVKQFMGESVLYSTIAVTVAFFIVIAILPFFNSFVERSIEIRLFQNPAMFISLTGLMLFVGVLSGSYPAILLSSFQPVKSLKESFYSGLKRISLRNALVIFQLSMSILLMISTITVYEQLQYVAKKRLGYNKEHVVATRLRSEEMRNSYQTVKTELLRNPSITRISGSMELTTNVISRATAEVEDKDGEELLMKVYVTFIDYDFLDLLEIEILSGRNFSTQFRTDLDKAVILNETAVRRLNWENPIGKNISVWTVKNGTVIGVVKDFHFQSLHQNIEPMALILGPTRLYHLYARIKPKDVPDTLAFFEKTYRKFSKHPIDIIFLDESFNTMYKAEQKFGAILEYFCALAIFVSCLGLFGLASFITERRFKEISIRKVLGASVSNLIILLSDRFIKWIILSNIIAWPIAYYYMHLWLQNFAYRINLGVWPFMLSAAIVLIIALFTISFQTAKAAITNPADSLRYE